LLPNEQFLVFIKIKATAFFINYEKIKCEFLLYLHNKLLLSALIRFEHPSMIPSLSSQKII